MENDPKQGRILLLAPRELYILARFTAICAQQGKDLAILLHQRELGAWQLVTYRGGDYVSVQTSRGDGEDQLVQLLAGDRYLGVVPTGEFSAQQAERIAARLGLFHNPLAQVAAYRDKHRMRRLFGQQGVRQPQVLARFATLDEVDDFDWRSVRFPVIAKPIDLTSSLYVRLCHDAAQARSVYRRIFLHVQSFAGVAFAGEGLLETYCDQPEFSAECVVRNGQLAHLYVTTKFVGPLPACDEIGHVSGAPVSARHREAACKLARRVARAWGTEAGVLHIEYRFDGSEAILMEAACRIGGDHISELVELQHGHSLEAELLTLRCPGVDLVTRSEPAAPAGYWGVRFLFAQSRPEPQPGVEVRRKVRYQRSPSPRQGFGIGDRLGCELLWSVSLAALMAYVGQDNPVNVHLAALPTRAAADANANGTVAAATRERP